MKYRVSFLVSFAEFFCIFFFFNLKYYVLCLKVQYKTIRCKNPLPISGPVDKAPFTEAVNPSSIPDRFKLKTIKLGFIVSLRYVQQKRNSVKPTPSVVGRWAGDSLTRSPKRSLRCLLVKSTSNQIFYCTRCITPNRVTSLRGPSPRHCAAELLSKKCYSGGESLATLCPI